MSQQAKEMHMKKCLLLLSVLLLKMCLILTLYVFLYAMLTYQAYVWMGFGKKLSSY